MCKSSKLKEFLDLGNIPLVDRFLTRSELYKKEMFYPLKVCICITCGLAQLSYVVPARVMYNSNYAYESSITKHRTKIYFKMANDICRKFKLKPDSLIVDVGSNVGLLLKGFKQQRMRVLGIEPSSNVARIAKRNGIETINDFFSKKTVLNTLKREGNAAVVTATNVFAHIHNLDSFMTLCKKLLSDEGIFVFQVPYFLHLLENNEYDTIYHEHVSYISVKPLVKFFKKFDMELFDINEVDIDGGALRCYVGKKGLRPISNKIQKFIRLEKRMGIHSLRRLREFGRGVQTQRKLLLRMLFMLKNENNRIVGISAPAKGNVLLNYCKIDNEFLDYVTEKSELKIGKYTPGTHIKVLPDDFLTKDKPDYGLILAWNFSSEIIKNLKKFRKGGGKFIIPIPYPKIV